MTEKPPRLQGRVAAILNARELVVNIGSLAGVKPGTKFAVLAETPIAIHDPTTNEVLDTVDREKVRVEAVDVRDHIAICRTYRFKGAGIFRATDAMRQIMGESTPETLRIDDSSTPPPLSEEESYVKRNDRVIAVTDY